MPYMNVDGLTYLIIYNATKPFHHIVIKNRFATHNQVIKFNTTQLETRSI